MCAEGLPQLVGRLGAEDVVFVVAERDGLLIRHLLAKTARARVMRVRSAGLLPAKSAADHARQRPDPLEVSWTAGRQPARPGSADGRSP